MPEQPPLRLMRLVVPGAFAALLSACASHAPPPLTASQEAAVYKSHAQPSYAPPGPPSDPWGPYVREASHRFDVPEPWIREVMNVESAGYEFRGDGTLTTSPVGAMGLMQLMPETYDEVRAQYGLGDDAYDPHNNILAGTAYIREMYDTFGAPGFLAAYNAGPARLEDYLTHQRALPDETRRYVYRIGSRIAGIYPQSRSPAEQYAVNQIPYDIPAGPRYHPHVNYALAARARRRHEAAVRYAAIERRTEDRAHLHRGGGHAIEVAEAPEPRVRLAIAKAHGLHFHLIAPAMAATTLRPGVQGNLHFLPAHPAATHAAARVPVLHAMAVHPAAHPVRRPAAPTHACHHHAGRACGA